MVFLRLFVRRYNLSDIKKDVNNDLEEIMKKYDKESNVRVFHGNYFLCFLYLPYI